LCCSGALQQACQPDIRLDGDDAAVGTCSLRGGDGEEADVGPDVPDGVSWLHELTGQIEEVGFEVGIPVFEAGIGRDIDQRRVEISGEVSQQDAVSAHLFYKGSQMSHDGPSLRLTLHGAQVMVLGRILVHLGL
jgi:hypothetical protein